MVKRILCFQNPFYLFLRNEQLIIRVAKMNGNEHNPDSLKEAEVKSVPIEDIGVIILDNQQNTITQAVMSKMLQNNVAIITCDNQHLPIGLQLPLSFNSLQHERWENQLTASEPLKKQMWQQTVVAKIKGQATILGEQGVETRNMIAWAGNVKSGDSENLEGRAAVYYWRNLFGDSNFVRGQEGPPPNNLLNYGYAVVRAMMARSLVAAGLLPTCGIHHHNRYNAYCLADDIMEPYRPFVDRRVVELVKMFDDVSELAPVFKQSLIALATTDVNIDGHTSPMMVAIQTTANSVQKCFAGEIRKIIYPDW